MSTDDTQNPPELFDPSAHTVDDVNAYLADADDQERERVLGLEDAPEGKQRATVTREFQEGHAAAQEPQEAAVESQTTKAATFAEAAAVQDEQPYTLPTQVTSTDVLAEQGESKGLTFAEQAVKARELYGSGDPRQED